MWLFYTIYTSITWGSSVNNFIGIDGYDPMCHTFLLRNNQVISGCGLRIDTVNSNLISRGYQTSNREV